MYYSYTILSGSRNSVDLDLLAIYLDDSAVGLVNSAEDLNQCGLSCTILTEQCVYLSQFKGKSMPLKAYIPEKLFFIPIISRTVCPILNLQVSISDHLLSCCHFSGLRPEISDPRSLPCYIHLHCVISANSGFSSSLLFLEPVRLYCQSLTVFSASSLSTRCESRYTFFSSMVVSPPTYFCAALNAYSAICTGT